ncbi:hypothetical protein C2845_PM17G04610 [Panicum miliaceum]|uniref:Uncharacterized protein n=1 Tax=Panicum miliaceum TaxID=4540 RepID=A0A3L6Q279_PANMI|nr:hypothetical protein C2845_PM17G04610 [Panicum miliaceum]
MASPPAPAPAPAPRRRLQGPRGPRPAPARRRAGWAAGASPCSCSPRGLQGRRAPRRRTAGAAGASPCSCSCTRPTAAAVHPCSLVLPRPRRHAFGGPSRQLCGGARATGVLLVQRDIDFLRRYILSRPDYLSCTVAVGFLRQRRHW